MASQVGAAVEHITSVKVLQASAAEYSPAKPGSPLQMLLVMFE